MVHKYLAEGIGDERLRMYAVWGPMLGPEVRTDGEKATALLPDPRVEHFWSEGHEVAELLRETAGLPADDRAWDTFLLFPPGVDWKGDGSVPKATVVMHVDKRLPEDQRLDAAAMAERVRAVIAAAHPAPGRP